VIENDNSDYRDRCDNSIKVHSTNVKLELWKCSSNTNSCLMVVELEAFFTSQVRIMKYEYLDKFLSIELEENICLKGCTKTMIRIHECLSD
jgi:hypothetical protein